VSERPQALDRAYDDIAIGEVASVERTFSTDDVLRFAAVSGDFSPLHVDSAYAITTEFGACVVHGMLLSALFSQLVGMQMPGRRALYLGQELVFRRPILVNEPVTAIAKVVAKSAPTRSIVLSTEIRGADGKVAVSGTARVKVREHAAAPTIDSPTHGSARSDRRVALVTGASRGIGAAVARELARRGCIVAVNYLRSADRAAEVVSSIREAGGEAFSVQADVRDADAVAQAVSTVTATAGPPTLLVNLAVGELGQRAFQELSWEDFLAQLEYQVKATMLTAQAVRPGMKAAGGGSIVNVLSQVTGGVPPTRMADYVTAKYALEGLSKALAVELAEDAIRVNTVSPGLIQTELTQFYAEKVFKMEALRTPLRRVATPEDVARTVAYLAGEDAAFVTGTTLFVTGGQVMT
jgi:3-oxoacyl-[acyl-carrier protein] reductase